MARLKADCSNVNELAGVFDYPLAASKKQVVASQTLETNSARLQSLSATGRGTLLPHGLRKIFAFFNCGYEMPALIQAIRRGDGPKTKAAFAAVSSRAARKQCELPVISDQQPVIKASNFFRQKGFRNKPESPFLFFYAQDVRAQGYPLMVGVVVGKSVRSLLAASLGKIQLSVRQYSVWLSVGFVDCCDRWCAGSWICC